MVVTTVLQPVASTLDLQARAPRFLGVPCLNSSYLGNPERPRLFTNQVWGSSRGSGPWPHADSVLQLCYSWKARGP